MCQRVVIALALACRPQLLIADEPTTGLDVTTQKTVMDLIVELTRERGMSTILITHDLGLAAAYCDRVVVMEKGHVVETATSRAIFTAPSHPYTRKLMRATPRPGVSLRDLLPETDVPRRRDRRQAQRAPTRHSRCWSSRSWSRNTRARALEGSAARSEGCSGADRRREPDVFRAVDGISFTINRGESVGLVGESGCGKSTTSTMVMRLIDKTDGTIMFDGEDIGAIPAKQFARLPLRKRIQMVFQDPTDSLNPRFTAARAIADPILRLGDIKGRAAVRARCEELATQVGLPLELLDRFPHQLSGGQKARVGIARAIALNPELVILDEPTAALDVSVQAVVLNLLQDLKDTLGMSYLFVSHDLNVVRLLCDRVIVMQRRQDRRGRPDRAGAVRAGGRLHARAAGRDPASDSDRSTRKEPGGSRIMTRRPKKNSSARSRPPRPQAVAKPARQAKRASARPFIAGGARALELRSTRPGCRRSQPPRGDAAARRAGRRLSRCRTRPSRRRCSRPEARRWTGRSASEIATRRRERRATARIAVVEAALARIAELNPMLNAFTAVIAERARARARAVDQRAQRKAERSGRSPACRLRSRTCSTSPACRRSPAPRSTAITRRRRATRR